MISRKALKELQVSMQMALEAGYHQIDIAKAAQVSAATVHRILASTTGIDHAMRDKVHKAVNALLASALTKPQIEPEKFTYRAMTAEKFSAIVDVMLYSLDKKRSRHNTAARDLSRYFEKYQRLYEEFNFLIQLINPYAFMTDEDFWSHVFLVATRHLKKSEDEVLLGTILYNVSDEILKSITDSYQLSFRETKTLLEALQSVRDRDMKPRQRAYLHTRYRQQWATFVNEVEISFPARSRRAISPNNLSGLLRREPFLHLLVDDLLKHLPESQESALRLHFGLVQGFYGATNTYEEIDQLFNAPDRSSQKIARVTFKKLQQKLTTPFREASLKLIAPKTSSPATRTARLIQQGA